MEIDRNGLEILDRTECLRLLGTATIGRVAITFSALPVVLPVNFRLIDDHVVIGTGVGTKLGAAACNSVVAFEVDDIDPTTHGGWSVLVTGVAREVTDPAERTRLQDQGLARWAPKGGGRVIEISTEMVSGRRITPGPTLSPSAPAR